jgi:NhaP-type Na+/H+ or K+/H+ antiporter
VQVPLDHALIVLGLLLAILAALSGWLRTAVLSTSILAVAGGAALAGLGAVSSRPDSPLIVALVELTLVLTLFRDGLEVEPELLRRRWRAPLRALAIAMPLTLGLIAIPAHALLHLSWPEALLLGAILMPTDPVITSTIVDSPGVPRIVRHTLNVESGLNDGLALPFVVVLIAVVGGGGGATGAGARMVGESAAGVAIGAALALGAGWVVERLPERAVEGRFAGLYSVGLALTAYGVAETTIGNGLLAAFVGGIAFALVTTTIPGEAVHFAETLSTGFQLMTFFAFGTLVVAVTWTHGWAEMAGFVVLTLVVARPLAVLVAFVGVRLSFTEKLFIAWFGPKGVASILFSLLALGSLGASGSLVFEAASFVVLGSVLAHGLTETLGARWIERHIQDEEPGPPAARREPAAPGARSQSER